MSNATSFRFTSDIEALQFGHIKSGMGLSKIPLDIGRERRTANAHIRD